MLGRHTNFAIKILQASDLVPVATKMIRHPKRNPGSDFIDFRDFVPKARKKEAFSPVRTRRPGRSPGSPFLDCWGRRLRTAQVAIACGSEYSAL